MAARAIWKGELKLGTHKIPVKLYSAVSDRTVRFNILLKVPQPCARGHDRDCDVIRARACPSTTPRARCAQATPT